MKFIFHGAANEVGRSCIEFCFTSKGKDHRVLIDAGFKVHSGGALHPSEIDKINDIDAVFISHAHLDHIGSLPYFDHIGMDCPIFMTAMTKRLSEIALKDSMHVELLRHKHPAYTELDLKKVFSTSKSVKYYHLMKYKNIEFEFMPAGHIPGSSMILLKVNGKNILYTGDFNTKDTRLLHGINYDFLKRHKIDIMISEATYGGSHHPARSVEERRFLSTIKRTLKSGGSVLIPVFSMGRAQEVLMLLDLLDTKVPIYLDGMAKKMTRECVRKELHIRNSDQLNKALERVIFVNGNKHRQRLKHRQGIIVTTSGMVAGGPVMEYLKHFWHDERDSILLTGFQAPGTNGRNLLEKRQAFIDGRLLNFSSNIDKFDFSAHAGHKDVLSAVKKISPKILILNHGDPAAIESLANDAKGLVSEVITPKMNATIFVG